MTGTTIRKQVSLLSGVGYRPSLHCLNCSLTYKVGATSHPSPLNSYELDTLRPLGARESKPGSFWHHHDGKSQTAPATEALEGPNGTGTCTRPHVHRGRAPQPAASHKDTIHRWGLSNNCPADDSSLGLMLTTLVPVFEGPR